MRFLLFVPTLLAGLWWGMQAAAEPAYGTPDCQLQRALRGCQSAAVEKALQAGADPNLRLSDGTPGVVRCVGNRQVLTALLAHGAEVDAVHPQKQRTALAELAQQKRLHREGGVFLLSLLLRHGADPNHVDAEGRHPLHGLAVSGSGAAMLQRLLDAGADGQARDRSGRTPLHLATVSGYAGNLELLLEAGADPNADDGAQLPALAQAVTQARIDVVQVLLEHGADPNLATRRGDGLTPLHLAINQRRLDQHGRIAARPGAGHRPAGGGFGFPLDLGHQERRHPDGMGSVGAGSPDGPS